MIETLVGTRGIEAVSEEHRSYCMVHDSKNDVYIERQHSTGFFRTLFFFFLCLSVLHTALNRVQKLAYTVTRFVN